MVRRTSAVLSSVTAATRHWATAHSPAASGGRSDHHAFSKRLQTACDNNVNVPPYGKGLQTWLSKRLGVSQEAVRRWFNAESGPRPQLLSQLSAVPEVDESWLALGITNAPKSSKHRAYSDKAAGAAYVCFGLLRAAGYACAFAEHNAPPMCQRRCRHFVAIDTPALTSKS